MSNNKLFVLVIVLLTALLAACQPTGAEPGVDETSGTSIPSSTEVPAVETPVSNTSDAITAAATAYLADELGVAAEQIEVVSVEPTEFSDSCLGLGGPAESCLQAITPGWIVMLSVDGQEYELHTDETGQQVRLAIEPSADDGAESAAVGAAQEFLSAELGVALGDVQVISATPTEFSDSCLGLGGPAESCLQAITPGWLIMAEVAGQEYEIHTDETGEQVRVAEDATAGDGSDTIAAAVQEFLSAELGVALGDIQVISAAPTEFTDGCLGLGGPDESCLQAITPGWLIMVEVAGQQYEVHTDQTGQQVRVAQ